MNEGTPCFQKRILSRENLNKDSQYHVIDYLKSQPKRVVRQTIAGYIDMHKKGVCSPKIPAEVEKLKVIFLGTNGWYDTATGNTICTFVQTKRYDILLDAGPTRYRKSSTIVSLNGSGYKILRPGVLDERMIQRLAAVNILFVCTGNTGALFTSVTMTVKLLVAVSCGLSWS